MKRQISTTTKVIFLFFSPVDFISNVLHGDSVKESVNRILSVYA